MWQFRDGVGRPPSVTQVVVLFSFPTGLAVRLYLTEAKGQIPVGNATKEANAPTVFAALEGPVLVELDGTSACRINLAAGEYF